MAESGSTVSDHEETVSSGAAANDNINNLPATGHQGFVCTICFKVFDSGSALGGHQTAHATEKSTRQASPNILAAMPNRPLPPYNSQALQPATLRSSSGSQGQNPQDPPLVPLPPPGLLVPAPHPSTMLHGPVPVMQVPVMVFDGSEDRTLVPAPPPKGGGGAVRGGDQRTWVEARGKGGPSPQRYHPYERPQVSEETLRRHLTKNLIGEWKPALLIKEEATAAARASQHAVIDPVPRDSKGELDLELRLETAESPDLDLRLGFRR